MATQKLEKNLKCYGQTNEGSWCQEVYDGLTKDARARAKELRKDGYKVVFENMGLQVTPVGKAKMHMLTILPGRNKNTMDVPYVQLIW